ncbi:bacteriocin [Chryseobacterium sp. OSA05B]|uniref:bacteriocin n=1 Tax=Chryseobacterium sp. OSA05B TaxID=2862650 RepID=UPI001CBB3FC5|nr:bacteriocin [Chryseobacterium sp. OSA05B]
MKNQNLEKGKKLNKKELRSITGGLMICRDPKTNQCRIFSQGCADPQCRPDPLD